VSFDLYVFDMADVPDDEEELGELMEDDSRWGTPPTPRLAAFIADLEARYPGLDDDPDGSPWSSWPLGDTMLDGQCAGFNIGWSYADAMSREFRTRCGAAGLTLYDPQEGIVIRPSGNGSPGQQARRPWWRRWRR
jgi:hypothetical protein